MILDEKDREVFVTHELKSDGKVEWGSFRRKATTGALERVKTKHLPMRLDKEMADKDLALYAHSLGYRRGWREI